MNLMKKRLLASFIFVFLLSSSFGIYLRNVIAASQQKNAISAIYVREGFQGLIFDSLAEAALMIAIVESSDFITAEVRSLKISVPGRQYLKKKFPEQEGFVDFPILSSYFTSTTYFDGYASITVYFSVASSVLLFSITFLLSGILLFMCMAIIRLQDAKLSHRIRDLAFIAIHDIRSPLAAIKIVAKLGKAGPYQKTLESASIRLEEVVEELILVARGKSIRVGENKGDEKDRRTSYVRQALEEIVAEKTINLTDNKKVVLDCKGISEFCHVEASPSDLKRTLSNLIDNALDASKPNSQVIVRSQTSSGVCVIEILDRGSGISSVDLERVMSKGYTSKKTGTGLGLYYARRFAIESKGDIEIQSTPDKGTCISVRLPLLTETAKIDAVLVDDDIWVREAWEHHYLAGGKQLATYSSFGELSLDLDAMDIDTPVYIDRHLNSENGDEVAKTLHRRGFKNLYLATSELDPTYDPTLFVGVIGKDPPVL